MAALVHRVARLALVSLVLAVTLMPAMLGSTSQAAGETRSLKLYFVHTGEKAVITFKRNGKFDSKGLQTLNRFLRDWRRNQPTKMDPRLFDLIWEVYRKSGSNEYIHVVSAFRSPQTNSMLRTRTKGVAEKSQHMLGKAMDFYLPDVKLATLRGIGMKMQVGGVGFYPKSGSPFVHMDVGNVRAWPRMSRQELVRLFPDGKTMHVPADGSPLPGYNQAVADHKRRAGATNIEIADTTPTKRKGFFATLFGGGADEAEESAPEDVTPVRTQQVETPAAVEQPVMTAAAEPEAEPAIGGITAPVPLNRPAFKNEPVASNMAVALVSPTRSAAEDALQAALPADPQVKPDENFADLQAYVIPIPSLLGPRRMNGDADTDVLTASAGAPVDALSTTENALSAVPVPANRPAAAEALLAQVNADDDVAQQEASLSPAVIAALEQNSLRTRTPAAATPLAAADDVAVAIDAAAETESAEEASEDYSTEEPDERPMEMAAVEPAEKPLTRSAVFGDAFDAPKASEAETEIPAVAAIPTKGGRPSKAEAEAVIREPVRTEPKLTKQIISQWALSQARMEVISKPVKAPRFVSPTLRAQPTSVYSAGFTASNGAVDPSRFSGTAVNFLQVRKFNPAK